MTLSDKQKLILATIITAVNQGDPIMGPGEIPSGHLYARLLGAVGLVEYQQLLKIAEAHDLIKQKRGHVIRITPYGAEVAEQISAVVRQTETNVTIN